MFDGTHRDRVDLGNPTNLQLENFTLEAWVKRSSPTVTSFDVLGADGSVCGDGACIIGYGRGGYIFALANDGRMILSRTDIDGLFSTPLVTDTNWHHLAVTKSGSNAVFYVDGVPQATPAYVHPDPYTFDDATCACSAAISIGSRGDARGGTFFGMIDEPAVFNRALSASEIQSIYAAGSAGKCAPNPLRLRAPRLLVWLVGGGEKAMRWTKLVATAEHAGTGNVTYGAGVSGPGFVFDGNRDGVYVGTNSSLQLQDLSIEGWVKRSSATQASFDGNGNGEIFVVGTYPGGCRFGIRQTDNHLEFGKPSGIQVSSAAQVADTNWHHVAVTRKGTHVVFYVDGVAYAAPTYTAGPFSFSAPAYIGAWWNPYGEVDNSFYGAIDELAVYNRELTAAELQAIYAAGSAGKCAPPPLCVPAPNNLVSWWRGEGNASDAVDGNHGTLLNGVTFAVGEVGQALSFDGINSYVEVPDSPSLRLTNALTIEFWVKRKELDRPYGEVIIEKGGDWTGGAQNYGVVLAPAEYGYRFAFWCAGVNRQTAGIADTNWHHCAVVARQGDVDPTCYIDGAQQPVIYREGGATINLYPSTRPLAHRSTS